MLNPRLKSRPQNRGIYGAATLVAGRILHKTRSKFRYCRMESETQRNRSLQPYIDDRWTFTFQSDSQPLWTSMSIPRLKSRPRDDCNSSGAATLVAGKTLYAVGILFYCNVIESQTQCSQSLQPYTDDRWTSALQSDSQPL